jgi:hypothetical protein
MGVFNMSTSKITFLLSQHGTSFGIIDDLLKAGFTKNVNKLLQ